MAILKSTVKVRLQNGTVKEFDTSSKEYRDLYNTGKLAGSGNGSYSKELPNVEVSATRDRTVWDKLAEENKHMGPLGLMTYGPASMAMSIPQLLAMKKITGKYQRPSEAMNITNPAGKMATDIVLDPVNLAGLAGGLARKGLSVVPGVGIDAPELGYHALNRNHWALDPAGLGGTNMDKITAYASAAANRLIPIWSPFKNPHMKQNSLGKKVIEYVMKQGAMSTRNLSDVREGVTSAVLGRKPGLYDGSLNIYDEARDVTRNLIDMYLYGPKKAAGFKEIGPDMKTVDFGDFYRRTHPDTKYYEMSSQIPNGEPVYPGNYSDLPDLVRNKNTSNVLREGSRDGAVKAKDDVAGYVEALRFDEAGGDPTLISQDHWGFLGNYADKWSGSVLPVSKVISEKQAAILNKVGKPFYLVQNNPVKISKDMPAVTSSRQVYKLDDTDGFDMDIDEELVHELYPKYKSSQTYQDIKKPPMFNNNNATLNAGTIDWSKVKYDSNGLKSLPTTGRGLLKTK